MHVMYSCNEVFVPQLCVSVLSLLENNKDLQSLQLYCVEDAISQEAEEKIRSIAGQYGRQIFFYPLNQVIERLSLAGTDRHPATIYSKLCMDFLDAEQLLYLDCDAVVAGSLRQLESLGLANNLAAGVAMPYGDAIKKTIGQRAEDIYICDGVVIFNMKLWKKEHKTEQAAEFIRRYHGRPPMLSEGTLNHICRGRIRQLPPCFNLMSSMIVFHSDKIRRVYGVRRYYSEQELMYAREHPLIIHYLHELYQRPWYRNSDHPYRQVYQRYAAMAGYTAEDFPGGWYGRMKLTRYCAQYLPGSVFAWLRNKRSVMKNG